VEVKLYYMICLLKRLQRTLTSVMSVSLRQPPETIASP